MDAKDEIAELVNKEPREALDKRFVRDFGCINFQGEEFMHELALAREYHRLLVKLNPKGHDLHTEEPFRCYTKTICKCGFSEAVDSSD